jgi:hypothetical protein
MSRSSLARALVQICLVASGLVACGIDIPDPALDGEGGGGGGGGGEVPGPTGAAGLPCEVEAFLENNCRGCHAAEPVGGAPMSLMSYRDLTAKNSAGITVAQRALSRIKNPTARMPPAPLPAVAAAEIAVMEDWVMAGTPTGQCGAPEPDPGPGGGPPPPPSPFDGPVVCTSGRRWTDGDDGSQLMHPGRACITCHTQEDDDDAPRLSIGGTVYPTGHEPNDCMGVPTSIMAVVEITDATGAVTMLPTNSSGNFLTTARIAFPIRVAVLANGKRRSMGMSPPRGDCNSCHTVDGANGAPGRIVIPY